MIGWFVWGAMDLAWTIEYAVQTGRTRIVIFEWPIPLTGLGAPKSGIDCRIFGVFTIFAALVFVALGFATAIPGF